MLEFSSNGTIFLRFDHIHMISSCSVDKFKSQLDKLLRNISDLPCQPRWWRLSKWRSLRRCPCCQLYATEQDQVSMSARAK